MDEANNQVRVNYHREGHLGFITLSRPEKRNALNWAMEKRKGEYQGA